MYLKGLNKTVLFFCLINIKREELINIEKFFFFIITLNQLHILPVDPIEAFAF